MLMDSFGLSFVPNGTPDPMQGGGQAAVEPVQQAIKYLSLRLPKFPQGAVLAPQALLSSPGGQGSPFARNAIGQTQPHTFAAMPDMSPAPAPSMPFGGAGHDPLAQALAILSGLVPGAG